MNEKQLTDNSIRSETVNTTTVITKTETEEILSDKISEIQEGVYTVEQLFDLNINLKWTINNILPVGGLMILSGSHGLGKSFMSLDLAVKMSHESSELWLNKFKLQSGPVAYIDTENGLSLIKHRLQLLGAKKEDELNIIYRRSLDINDASDYNQLSDDLKSCVNYC